MKENNKKFVDEEDVIKFLDELGIKLDSEGKRELRKRLKDEPIERSTLRRSKSMAKSEVFKDVLDLTLTEKARRIENNPLLKKIREFKEKLHMNKAKEIVDSRFDFKKLNKIFYDESKWERYYPDIVNIDEEGVIVKVQDKNNPRQYIGHLRKSTIRGIPKILLLTTKRERMWKGIKDSVYWRLKEIPEKKLLEKEFYNFISYKLKELKDK